jgi:two-component system sensor histidine kinase PhoQ
MKNHLSLFFSWTKNSLKARLLISALLMIIIILPSIGITLHNAFEKQIKNSAANELSAYSYAILAVAEVENKSLFMPDQLLDNQFNVSQTGLYALFTTPDGKKILWQSKSLLGLILPKKLPTPTLGEQIFSEIDLDETAHLIYSFSVSFTDNEQSLPVTLHIIKDKTGLLSIIADFKQQLWLWLFILMALLIIIQIVWLVWTLKPLTQLQRELADIDQGKANKLVGHYPQELSRVTKQLNALLDTEKNQRQRYRNALSDLAHSLKTPLAVIQSQQNLSTSTYEHIRLMNKMIEHQLKRAQSAGKSAWHLGISIKPVVEKMCNTLQKLYQHKQLTITQCTDEKALFKGDETDLMEILGNLLDNACKAAQHKIHVTVTLNKNKLLIKIADDGNGVASEQRQAILQRGTRTDTYQQGHGIGLAIVLDLVTSYQGKLIIEQSTTLGGALFILEFVQE